MLLGTFVNEVWWPSCGKLRECTRVGYESAYRCHIQPKWAGVDMESITANDIEEWLGSFNQAGAARKAWAEFLDGARFILQNGGSLGLDKSPADYRRGNHAPLQDFLSECKVCALFCPPTYEEMRQFAARHFTGGLP